MNVETPITRNENADKKVAGFKRLKELEENKKTGHVTFWVNKGMINDVDIGEKV